MNVKLARFLAVVLGLFGVALASCQTKTVVKPGDNINIVCEEEPSLSKDYTITRDGYVVMQFIGAVAIAGFDEPTAAAKVSATLIEQRILPRATVKLKILGAKTALIGYAGAVERPGDMYPREGLRLSDVVAVAQPTAAANLERVRVITATGKELAVNYRAHSGADTVNNPELRAGDRVFFDLMSRPLDVTVTGQVAKPGVLEYKDGLTVKSAISSMGGLSAGADSKSVRVEHAGQVKEVDIDQENVVLMAGDRVFIPEMKVLTYVMVNGAVMKPSRVPFRDGLTLSQAVEASGGPFAKADLKKVSVIRMVDGKEKSVTHDLAAIYASKAGDVPLRANDKINVPMAGAKRSGGSGQVLKIAGAVILGVLFGILHF